jgi:hypothetical protein
MSFVELDQEKNITVTLENIVINASFSNFSGAPSLYNNPGDQYFFVTLPSEVAVKLEEDGWNVRKWEIEGEASYQFKVSCGKKFDPQTGQLLLNSGNEEWKYINDGDTINVVGVYWHIPSRDISGFKAYFVDIKKG